MKICRFNDNRIGVVRDDGVHDVTAILDKFEAVRYPFPLGDQLIERLQELRPELESLADGAAPIDTASVNFLSPVANPTKIIGVPANYHAHREEAKNDPDFDAGRKRFAGSIEEQGLFLKANSALVGPSEGVAVRFPDKRTDHEAELGVIIGKRGSDIPIEEAFDYVAGYALAMDMVVRGGQDRSMRKSIDTYAVLGPWMITKDEVPEPEDLDFELRVNGEVRQKANTSMMIMKLAHQISWGSNYYTLVPGDIIMSGTCAGVSKVEDGDTIEFDFEGIGSMTVPVRAHS
ncbi:MAG: fumarylacetoacetate hydrolase family protein [Rhodospirillaceae bacterium]|jgi:2-keto-4-pentenoate hydratase/2-oxohepta-3-ene-1,7-dioic acid hydratase in catechol pathway|nr:fumarylacetoacetate hydrolase family protein [Rhodospirillaceae bacterium]MBT3883495.1 fumarylacetoacetate hydrolase family protein [Rhodospirillaceae bacterium]MBT4116999.1 fumarylacetoacetate hydrolase family protein [Rhodospirillaceae bacterium]MBT4672224.1 fumarylacetoacetate hydrolase family protein [Rhodospirillaceae bacterium]MBT4719517.1 fumarylacetoacetate hydrolase family protein [Rhodospirillaceae bacterium]